MEDFGMQSINERALTRIVEIQRVWIRRKNFLGIFFHKIEFLFILRYIYISKVKCYQRSKRDKDLS